MRLRQKSRSVLDEIATVRSIALILDRIQKLELPAALRLDRAREARGCNNRNGAQCEPSQRICASFGGSCSEPCVPLRDLGETASTAFLPIN
jgi:hypothetical protein